MESVLKKDKVNFVQAEVTKIDRDAKKVETNQGIYGFYDILVVALGLVT